jgi:adenylate cyclase
MSSILPNFEYDIFISYRQKDNKGNRWVTHFVDALKTELESTFKEDISIYFDENPHDGLLEMHHVEQSLQSKLKCLVFIPIISHTYCDSTSFAWQKEFCVFNSMAASDSFGRDVKLGNGNVASRILPIKIHDIDEQDKATFENEIKGVLRAIDFTFKSAGVNRPLNPSDKREENQNKTVYRDQLNKVANAIKEIISALKNPGAVTAPKTSVAKPAKENTSSRKIAIAGTIAAILILSLYLLYNQFSQSAKNTQTVSEKQSIAVLPFVNLSGDLEQEYFSDGLTDEMITMLAKLPSLKVIGRTSSFQFKGKNVDLREIGKQLGVTTLLEGSVRKSDDRIRITVQLVDASDGSGIWSQTYDLKQEEILKVQNEIARSVIAKLRVTFLDKQFTEARAVNTEAYEYYLKAKDAWSLRKLKESEAYFTRAIEADSMFAPAYIGLAGTCVLAPLFRLGTPTEYFPKAEAAAKKAIQLDSSMSLPYLTMAIKSDNYDLNPAEAARYFKKALYQNSYFAALHYFYGQHLIRFDKNFSQGEEEMKKAVELEPLESVPHTNLGYALMMSKKYMEAIEALKYSIELNPDNDNSLLFLGHCYMELGNLKKAKEAYLRSAELSNDRAKAALVHYFMKNGDITQATFWYDDLVKQSSEEYVSNSTLAAAASFLKKKDEANERYKKAFENKDSWLINPNLDYPISLPDDLFADPRNTALLRMHIPGYSF